MSSGGETEETHVEPRVVMYPLNSRRLTAQVVHGIAAALELPKAPLADARQMVERFLSKDHEPRKDLVESETEAREVRGERDKTHERITVLEAELERAARHNADLKEEVEILREKVKEEGEKNRRLWRLHCENLVEYYEQIASKEERIEDAK